MVKRYRIKIIKKGENQSRCLPQINKFFIWWNIHTDLSLSILTTSYTSHDVAETRIDNHYFKHKSTTSVEFYYITKD